MSSGLYSVNLARQFFLPLENILHKKTFFNANNTCATQRTGSDGGSVLRWIATLHLDNAFMSDGGSEQQRQRVKLAVVGVSLVLGVGVLWRLFGRGDDTTIDAAGDALRSSSRMRSAQR